MAKTCTSCGSPLKDNSKFCEVCGTPVSAQPIGQERFCVQCGNLLKPGIKFCEVCGREVVSEKPKEEPKIAEPTTMEELVIPEITEDTFASNREVNGGEKFDGFEAAVMPDSKPVQPQAPAPAPQFSMDTANPDRPVNVKAVPRASAAVINSSAPEPAPRPAEQFGGYPQPGAPIPTVGADGKEKKQSLVVPIILAVLIVAVLVADVIIFTGHKKDDGKDSEKNAVTVQTYAVESDTNL